MNAKYAGFYGTRDAELVIDGVQVIIKARRETTYNPATGKVEDVNYSVWGCQGGKADERAQAVIAKLEAAFFS